MGKYMMYIWQYMFQIVWWLFICTIVCFVFFTIYIGKENVPEFIKYIVMFIVGMYAGAGLMRTSIIKWQEGKMQNKKQN